jgi:DNA polymerase-3 subunit delta
MPPDLKPAYLIHGDDHGALAERRARLRALAEAHGGAGGLEVLEGDAATPEAAALALSRMTFAIGRRVIIVDGAERWRDADVQEHLAAALAQVPADTTIAFFAREEGRHKAPAALHAAVQGAAGQVAQEVRVKPWELPRWVRDQAQRLGLELDAGAAKALVAQVGERQQRLLRELEKLSLDLGDGAHVTAEDVEQRAAHSTEWRAFTLADALVGGDAASATASYLRLRAQGERLSGLSYQMAARLREAVTVAGRLEAGESAAAIKRTLRMPPRVADRFLADVARADVQRLRDALAALADLELDTRGGAPVRDQRSPLAGLGEDTLAVEAIERMAG